MRIAVIGASGNLGGAVMAKAAAAGHEPVAVCRSVPAALPAGATHVVADVTTGEGLADAFAAADVVIDGTNAMANAHAVLVDGTAAVLEVAKAAGVRHFVGISIVGIDDAPLAYYRVKLEQEQVIARGVVPWSLLRATQFHELIPRFVAGRLGVVFAPIGWKLQPIDVGEVAAMLVAAAEAGPAGRLPDVGGPEILSIGELARAWKQAAHRRRLILSVPVSGKAGAFLRSGNMCCPDRKVGTITFASWLARQYG